MEQGGADRPKGKGGAPPARGSKGKGKALGPAAARGKGKGPPRGTPTLGSCAGSTAALQASRPATAAAAGVAILSRIVVLSGGGRRSRSAHCQVSEHRRPRVRDYQVVQAATAGDE